jgi:polar amino acid transport system substrate-binding protein
MARRFQLLLALVCACAITASVASVAFAGEMLDRILSEKKIRIGLVPGWPKFLVMNPDTKKYEGFLADDLANFETRMGIKVEYVSATWAGIVGGLQAGTFDVMIGATITPERATAVAFGIPYAYYNTSALTRPDSPATSLADLDQEGKILTVVTGTAMHTYARRYIKKAKLSALADSSTAVLEVIQGRADGYIGDSWTNSIRAKERPAELKLVEFKPTETEWGGLALATRYQDADLLLLLNAYVQAMKLQRWYHQLAAKYDLPANTADGPQ